MQNKAKNFFKALSPAVVMFAAQNAIAVMFIEVLIAYNAYKGSSAESLFEAVTSPEFTAYVSLVYAVICIPLYMFWYRKVKASFTSEDVVWKPSGLLIPGVIMVAVGAQYISQYIAEVIAIAIPEWMAQYESLLESAGLADSKIAPTMLAYAVFFAPIAEELAFRGICFSYMKRIVTDKTAILVQALLFAGIHANPLQGAYTFLFGLVAGYIYSKTHRIIIPIIIHMIFNATSAMFVEYMSLGENMISFYFILLISLFATYFGIMFCTKPSKAMEVQ